MKNILIKIILTSLAIFLIMPVMVYAEELPQELSIPGTIQGTGTYFKIADSEYLNVSLESSEEIIILFESVPKTISLNLEASSIVSSAQLTLGNLEANTIYYKFEDSYKNKNGFTANDSGEYTWEQDLTSAHHIWFQPNNGTVYLPEDCSFYGNWDEDTSICTITQDLSESVEITQNDIALDCNGNSIIGDETGYGIYVKDKQNIVIKNCDIVHFSYGVQIQNSSNNTLIGNNILNNQYGIILFRSNNNTLTDNNLSLNQYGIYLSGGDWCSHHNNLSENIFEENTSYGLHIPCAWSGSAGVTLCGEHNNIWKNKFYDRGAHSGGENYFCADVGNYYEDSVPVNQIPSMDCGPTPNNDVDIDQTKPSVFEWDISATYSTIQEALNNLNINKTAKIIQETGPYIENSRTVRSYTTLNCQDETLQGDNTGNGIYITDSHTTVKNCKITNFARGAYLNSKNNTLFDNRLFSNENGIYAVDSNNTITNNDIDLNQYGISLYRSNDNVLTNNRISSNQYGVYLSGGCSSSFHNQVIGNTIQENTSYGLYLGRAMCGTAGLHIGSDENEIYHNNFIDNPNQALDKGTNSWTEKDLFDNGYPLDFDLSIHGGNYWSDYDGIDENQGPNQDQSGSDGIGDTLYAIYNSWGSVESQDNYPFMEQDGWGTISDLNFRANPDGFKFRNYCTTYFDEKLDKEVSRTWEMFEQFFGREATTIGNVRRFAAERFFDKEYARYDSGECGSCDGFSGSSLINFEHLNQPNAGPFAMPYYHNLYLQDFDNDIENAIAYQQGFQFSLETISYVAALKEESNNSPNFFYEKIKESIQNKKLIILWILTKPEEEERQSGHSLVPYKYDQISDSKAYVYVYDSNYPCDNNRKVIFNFENDRWTYKFKKGWWFFGETWKGDSSFFNMTVIPLSMRLHKGTPSWFQEDPFVYVCSTGKIVDSLFVDQEGQQIGFVDNKFMDDIPGASYITPPTQTQDKTPGFYYLPEKNDYTVTLRGTEEGTADFSAFGNNLLIEITDATVHPTTIDNIKIGRGEKSLIYSTNDDYKEYSAVVAQELPEASRVVKINTNIAVGDITTLEITDEQIFKYVNAGDTKTYNLLLEQRGAGAGQTSLSELIIGSNDTHIIEITNWNDLENTTINAEIDYDSDGTIDEIQRLQVIPKQLKEEVKTNLENAKTNYKFIDREIDLIIKHIERSLDDALWIDDFRLDSRRGKRVFHEEFVAGVHLEYKNKLFEKIIPKLEKIIEKKQKIGLDASKEEFKLTAIKSILPVFQQAVYDLVKADEKIVERAISDAKNTSIENSKFQMLVDQQIKKAEKELSKAKTELDKGRMTKAIARFGKSWAYAQLAIKFAKFNK